MLSLSARRPLDNWNYDSIRPGVVGQVGDANLNITFKSTFPGDYREAPYTAGDKEVRYGSNVRDGDVDSPLTGSQGARVEDGFFGGMRDSQNTQRGWVFQNLKPEEMLDEPVMGSLPQYKWRNQVATIMNAAKSGEKFRDLPGGYKPGPFDLPRGGNKPGVVAGEGRGAQYIDKAQVQPYKLFPSGNSSGLTIDPGTSEQDLRRRMMRRYGGSRFM